MILVPNVHKNEISEEEQFESVRLLAFHSGNKKSYGAKPQNLK